MGDIVILRENGKEREISAEELEGLKQQQPKVKLMEVDKGIFVKLERMEG